MTPSQLDLKDTVVNISRVTKVVKGGKNLSFSALVVVGDGHGVVGLRRRQGEGSALGDQEGHRGGEEVAHPRAAAGTTVPHPVLGRFGAGQVLLKPAPDGTGIIAGGAVRAVVESCGIQNVLTKSLGSANPHNVVRATFAGLMGLKDPACGRASCAARKSSRQSLAGRDAVERMAKKTSESRGGTRKVKITLVQEPDRVRQDAGGDGPGHGPAPDRPHGGAGRHARDARHDSQGPAPGRGANRIVQS